MCEAIRGLNERCVTMLGKGTTMSRLFVVIALGFALGASLCAQDSATPDLSGTWVLNLQKSKLAKGNRIRSRTVVITSSASTIVAHFVTSEKKTDESTETYITDGKEYVIGTPINAEEVSKAHWEKSTLVVDVFLRLKMPTKPAVDGMETSHWQERWTLSSDGHVLTQVANLIQSSVYVYDKQ